MLHTSLQFTAGGTDEDGNVLAVNCNCFYTSDRGATANPPGALWRVVAADDVPEGAEVARTVSGDAGAAAGDGLTFLHPLDNTALYIPEAEGDAVAQFKKTRQNPYHGNAQAIAAGKTAYGQWCAGCHLADGTGRIGSNLVDDDYRYPRTNTDVGNFEVIYAGATGAMQAFGDRVSQDDILKIIAYMKTLKK